MNLRTIIFVLLCSATFFGLNIFFSYQREKNNQAYYQQLESDRLQQKELLQNEIQEKTATLSELPLVQLTDGQGVQANGIKVGENVLTLAWKQPLPESVFADGKELKLLTKESIVDAPVVYAAPDFKSFEIAGLPSKGSFDVQVLSLPTDGSEPQVTYGVYRDKTLYFPGQTPKQNGIALHKSNGKYLPLGFYEGRSGVFVELQELPVLSSLHIKKPEVTSDDAEQKFYVLENNYQQLVFTNVGGALAEINLPFESKENSSSVVKEIEFDREILTQSPQNATFPLHPYYVGEERKTGVVGGYYPLLRRGTIQEGISPENYAFNIVSDYPEMAKQIYEVKEFTKNKIVFEAIQSHRKITKTYTIKEENSGAPYIFDLDIKIDGSSKGLMLTSGVPEVEIMSNSSSPQIQYRVSRKHKSSVEKLDLPKVKESISVSSVTPDWVANSNGYLGIIMDPQDEIASGYKAAGLSGDHVPTRLALIDPEYEPYKPAKYPGYEVLLPLPSQGGNVHFRVYAGPFEENTLRAVDRIYTDPGTGYNPDYIASRTFYGWFSFISEPFAKLLFYVMKFFYYLTSSWALAIILLTVFLRILLYPLNAWSMKSMYRMKEISPEVQAIQKKYKKDPKKAQMEIMTLYREKKVNPFTGCLPLLIQLPFLIAMFDLLKSSFQLRGAGFIPGWIDNLTAPDVLFQWSRPLFFIGNQFHLLPFLLGGVMFLQQKFSNPAAKEKREMTDQERQQRAMGTMMAVIFTIMFYNFPSGLNIYWLSSMLLGILQQWITNKMMAKKRDIQPAKKAKAKAK